MTIAVAVPLLALALVRGTPILLAALGGVLSERAGIVNIALEGEMTAGAFTAALVSYFTQNAWIGALGGVIVAATVGLLLGYAAAYKRFDQIVAGMGINLICLGGAAFGLIFVFNQAGVTPQVPALNGALWPLVALAVLLACIMQWALSRSVLGLRLRACGENPYAARAAGIDPLAIRLYASCVAGALAGLGGVFLALGELNLYSDGMIAGRGFIALAAVIFGRWTALGAAGVALVFGFLEALQFALQGATAWLPSDLVQALPYVAALVALLGAGGRYRPPAAEGKPYP
ncbi:MAG TPA: ABC transporter permease [Candidatus Dormibacteraeota bacterium]|nr:ABC transporter permease [Candidatus Dormibacteraeota bacterium]